MTNRQGTTLAAFLLFATSAGTPAMMHAQLCHGTPRGGGVSGEVGTVTGGTTFGGSVAFAGEHAAFGIGVRSIKSGSNDSRLGGALRFSVGFGNDRLQVCPGIGLGFDHGTWNLQSGSLSTFELTGRGGVGAGYDIPVYADFGLIPFVVVEYAETGTYYDLKIPNSKSNNTANTAGRAEAEYGLTLHYQHVYAGFVGNHTFESGRPFSARWLLGYAF